MLVGVSPLSPNRCSTIARPGCGSSSDRVTDAFVAKHRLDVVERIRGGGIGDEVAELGVALEPDALR